MQGSPTDSNPSQETYRHALAATAVRRGTDDVDYLYTLNLSCPEKLWSDMQPQFKRSIDSFRLVEPSSVSLLGAVCQLHYSC
jgi:PsbP